MFRPENAVDSAYFGVSQVLVQGARERLKRRLRRLLGRLPARRKIGVAGPKKGVKTKGARAGAGVGWRAGAAIEGMDAGGRRLKFGEGISAADAACFRRVGPRHVGNPERVRKDCPLLFQRRIDDDDEHRI